MKKIILSSLMIVALGSAMLGATAAFFSDVETSTGNTFTAGAVDLLVDNEAWYNGVEVPRMSWKATNLTFHKFFELLDVKPGDWEEDTISLVVNDNPTWMCMNLKLTSDDDVSTTTPEKNAGDNYNDPLDLFDGELASRIQSIWWADDGDNVLEADEMNGILAQGTMEQLASTSIPLADVTGNVWNPQGGPVPGETTMYIGKAFCFGTMTLTPVATGTGQNPGIATGFSCDGTLLDNITQTDTLTADLSFFAVQSRNNPKFTCAPGDIGCLGVADLMLVMDRSGSIDPTELTTMKTAAKAFVDALVPSTAGIHAGLVSFSGTSNGPLSDASMDQRLTDDGTAVKTAIDSLGAGGLTNLWSGLALTADELEATSTPDTYNGLDREPDITSPDIVVVLTDGNPNVPGLSVAEAKAYATEVADALKLAGATIYVVGIGGDVDATYLQGIASTNAHYFPAADFDDLELILQGLANCGD